MSLAPETTVRILTRHLDGGTPATTTGGVLHVVGSRSEAVRLAPLVTALRIAGVPQAVARLAGPEGINDGVLDEHGLPRTEHLVEPSRGTEVERTAQALTAAEVTLTDAPPRFVLLAGDAESSLAFALAAAKLGVKIARIGGGLRSGDFSESSEINRVLGDRLADIIFTDSREASDALEAEGIPAERIFHVGSTAVDLVRRCEHNARERALWTEYGLEDGGYVLAALRGGANSDAHEQLVRIAEAIASLGSQIPVLLSLHPATRALIDGTTIRDRLHLPGVTFVAPMGYVDFLSLEAGAAAIVTDSGAIQDEASALGVRTYTVRHATERVTTLLHGTNILLGDDPADIAAMRINRHPAEPLTLPFWDGRASNRIAARIASQLAA
jgi:UDP-N-acetylglucosamine 2-epimerase (non-hydrolysing)